MLKWPSNQHEKYKIGQGLRILVPQVVIILLSLDTTLGLDGFLLVTINSLSLVCNQLTERLTDILLGIQS